MNTYTDRGEGVAELVEMLTDPENLKNKIPEVEAKLRILVKGQYKGHSVLANGNMWLPEKKTAKRMADAMGQEVSLLFAFEEFCYPDLYKCNILRTMKELGQVSLLFLALRVHRPIC